MRAGEGGGKGGNHMGWGAQIYIYLDEAGFGEIEGEDEDLEVFFLGVLSVILDWVVVRKWIG